MKFLLKMFFLLFPFILVSQTNSGTKISKAKLITDSLITGIVKDIPADCKVTGYAFSIKTNNKDFKINCVGNELRIEIQKAFKKANVGDVFSFDKMETACLEKHKKKYIFIITD
jgi:hypothetical protein